MSDALERIEIESSDALWDWLELNHQSQDSFLLVTWKKSDKVRYISRDQVLDALLAYGWIDGRRYVLDDDRTMQLICKRKQQKWTQSYRDRIEKLVSAELMKPSGLSAVEHAKANGNWLANRDVDDLVCPSDLTELLHHHQGMDWWQKSAPSYRRNILRWLSSAKKTETRQKRCLEIAIACGAGRKIKNM